MLPEIPDLPAHLRGLVAQIPRGKVSTYGRLATALGAAVAARWVGHDMLHHDHHRRCACHRVVRADGSPGEYIAGTSAEKAERLAAEGIPLERGRVDLARFGMGVEDFLCQRPLEELRAVQQALAARVSLQGRRKLPDRVGGVDVSYRGDSWAVAAYALVEVASGALIWSTTVSGPVGFPYISSFLAFRELPILLELVASVRNQGRLAEVMLVDGSGVLHPRRAGVASHLGVLSGVATVGVTKKRLVGRVDVEGMGPEESRPVVHAGRARGVAIRPTSGSRRPIYVSPGHCVSLPFAERVVRRLLRGRRLPEPVYWADRLSRAEARSGQPQYR